MKLQPTRQRRNGKVMRCGSYGVFAVQEGWSLEERISALESGGVVCITETPISTARGFE